MDNVVNMDDVQGVSIDEESVTALVSRRREEILEAAFEVFIERGYEGANTLAIARRARTSKETLYNYFGSKRSMFEELVDWMTERMYGQVGECLRVEEDDLPTQLHRLGICLLGVWGHGHNIALLRIAAAYAHTIPDFGQRIKKNTDACVRQLFIALMERGCREGILAVEDSGDAFDTFVGLLLGGSQFRRIIGCERQLSKDDVAERASRAVDRFLILFSVQGAV